MKAPAGGVFRLCYLRAPLSIDSGGTKFRGRASPGPGSQIEPHAPLPEHAGMREIGELDVALSQVDRDLLQLPRRHADRQLATQIGEPAELLDVIGKLTAYGVELKTAPQTARRQAKTVQLSRSGAAGLPARARRRVDQ